MLKSRTGAIKNEGHLKNNLNVNLYDIKHQDNHQAYPTVNHQVDPKDYPNEVPLSIDQARAGYIVQKFPKVSKCDPRRLNDNYIPYAVVRGITLTPLQRPPSGIR